MSNLDILAKLEQHKILPTPQRIEIASILLRGPQHLMAAGTGRSAAAGQR